MLGWDWEFGTPTGTWSSTIVHIVSHSLAVEIQQLQSKLDNTKIRSGVLGWAQSLKAGWNKEWAMWGASGIEPEGGCR